MQFWPNSANTHKTLRSYIPLPPRRQRAGERPEVLLISSLWGKNLSHELTLPSDPNLCQPNTCINRRSGLSRPAVATQTLTLAHEGRRCFPGVDSGSDEHHFLFSPWTQVLCSRRGGRGQAEKERKVLKLGPIGRTQRDINIKAYPFIKIGHTL